MSFRDLNLKVAYDSTEDDIVNDFLIPVLSSAKKYYRITGFFSSSALAIAARGLFPFIKNDGEMKLICSVKLKRKDLKAIKEGLTNPQKVIETIILEELEQIDNPEILDHVKLLAWMIANDKLKIKVAIRRFDTALDTDGALDFEMITHGIFHQKIGIFIDKEQNIISFSGSINETAGAWLNNIEEFKVFRSWVANENKYLESDINKFWRYWYNQAKNLQTFSIPEAAKRRLISMAPKDINELKHLASESFHIDGIKLRYYQTKAIQSWFSNNQKGILEMATGTGKTITAIGILKKLYEKHERLLTVITVPYIHLATQWRKTLSKFGIKAVEYHSQSKNSFELHMFNYRHKIINKLVIITVHPSFSNEKFTQIMSNISEDIFLIADECHWLGAPNWKKGLLSAYTKRLGLSATPFRWLDEEGTKELISYFDDIVFKFPLQKAIPHYLTPYEYHPIFIEFTAQELDQYRKFSTKIATIVNENQVGLREKINIYLVKRAKLIINAQNKYKYFEQIIDSFQRNISHCLVYCSPEQLRNVQKIINLRGFLQHKITQEETIEEREEYIRRFANGEYQFLTAIKCLDEGVDVPATKIAFFMSNSGNPREFIQRRGRILRKAPNKKYAIIYDFIVMPPINKVALNEKHKNLEIKFIKRELDRYKEFAGLAINAGECLKIINKYEEQMRE